MKRKRNFRGIAFKTFCFTSLLISAVTLISFGILYAAMPRYYSYVKERELTAALDRLVDELESGVGEDDVKTLITDISIGFNADIWPISADGGALIELSSTFLSLEQYGAVGDIALNLSIDAGEESNDDGAVRQHVQNKMYITISETEPESASSSDEPENGVGLFYISRSESAQPMLSISRSVEASLEYADISEIYLVYTPQPIDEAREVMLGLLPYVLAVNITITLLASWFYTRNSTRPILLLSDTAARMHSLEPEIVSGIRTRDELGELSENLDSLYAKFTDSLNSLQIEMDKVSRLEKSKTDFMRAASHELKTPISALSGVIEGMTDNVGMYTDRDRFLLECKKLVGNMTLLVNEILSASRADTARECDLEERDIAFMLSETLDKYRIQIEENGLDLHNGVMEFIYPTDGHLLSGVLSNLISNAVHYTPADGCLDLSLAPYDGGRGRVLTIANTSAPIPLETISKLFDPFFTQSYSRNRKKSGTGLGLYIVKRNLERLGLEYSLENTETGVAFRIRFPEREDGTGD